MRTKNIYTADLNLDNLERKTISFTSDDNKHEIRIEIERNDTHQMMYKITNLLATDSMSDVKELIERRYLDEEYDEDAFNQRLRDSQYEIRKAFKALEDDVEIEQDVLNHELIEDYDGLDDKPKKEKATPEQEPEVPAMGLEAMIAKIVKDNVKSNKDVVEAITKKYLDDYGVKPNRQELVIKTPKTPEGVNVGTQHKDFPELLTLMSVRENVALVGAAGSGKTTAVINAAKALELPFYSKSVSAQTGVHEFFGYQDANGNYVSTAFREAFENGGVFLLDEYDNGNPNVLASMNQAAENPVVSFADGMVERHEDFIIVMAGNTYGHGATSQYVGRNKIDDATLDRFLFMNWEYDEEFEMNLARNKKWCKEVQRMRKKAADKKVKVIISPRATFKGEKLLEAGLSEERVKQLAIFKGMSADEIELIS